MVRLDRVTTSSGLSSTGIRETLSLNGQAVEYNTGCTASINLGGMAA
jgi:hypothetical protein